MTDDASGVRGGRAWDGPHRVVWRAVTGVVAGTGVLATLFEPELVSRVGVFLVGAALALAVVFPFAEDPWRRPRRWVELALGGGVAAMALQGLAAWLGWWTLVVVVLLAGASPWTTAAVVRLQARRTPDMSPFEGMLEEVAADEGAPDHEEGDARLRALDVDQLCLRWVRSLPRLQEASSPEAALSVARERAALLRELTRRDPEGVAAWLADGPLTTGDPRRYLRRTQDG